ncbi:MAG: type III-A CRISPR-associated RAMP protein Csm4 [Chloroflexaceae bacterium]
MTALTVYWIVAPTGAATLSFHFGRQGIGLEETGETLPSDSLFAALVAQAALLDPAAGNGAPPAFARPFVEAVEDGPPLLHSSLFPRLGALLFLPRPMLRLPPMDERQRWRIGKGFKKLRYLSPRLFAAVVAGRPFDGEPIVMQGGKVWLDPAEAGALPAAWQRQPREDETAWRRRLVETPIWTLDAAPQVAVDRVSNASAYYEVGRVTYPPQAGLALVVRFGAPAARDSFERLLTLLGESGLGGRRSSGYGAFHWERGPELTLDLGPPGGRAVLLSRYLPRAEELEALRSERAAYQLVDVGGWFYSPGQPTQRRQRVLMVAEGAVLDVRAAPVRGRVENVAPDYSKSSRPHPRFGRGSGVEHPVYRSGLALMVPIPDPPEDTAHEHDT